MIIDTHAHIYSEQFNNEVEALLQRAKENSVDKIVMPNIDLDSLPKMLELGKKHPNTCYPMLGLHPCDVFDNYEEVLNKLYSYFDSHSFVAVGEIGLDLFHDKSFYSQQLNAFHIQIAWALEKNLPIAIHSRNANDESIGVISQYKSKNLKGVFHCFSGSVKQAEEIIELGFYLGIGGVVTYKNSGLDSILKEVGISKIVLETDAPYLSPVPLRGKRNEPAYLSYIVTKLASIFEIAPIEVENITTANAKALFSI